MRSLLFVPLVLLVVLGGRARADEDARGETFLPHTPASWLVIAPLDFRTRRPFNPDAVFARHLLDPTSPPPKEGDTLTGECGTPVAWRRVAADAEGRVGGDIAYAYSTVEAPSDLIVMAWLQSGGTLFVNGTPYAGAIYGDRFEVPVKLVKGINHVFVMGVRGAFRLTLTRPPAGIFLAPFRQTKPDLVAGESVDAVAGLLVVNAREQALAQVLWQRTETDWLERSTSEGVLPIAPLSIVQVQVPLKTKAGKTAPNTPGPVEIPIRVGGALADEGQETTFTLDVREREQAVIRTFVSGIDDSVQQFGMREPLPGGEGPMGLVLTLHGAGVEPRGQVNSYAPKQDFWIVAPTNRDRFGFDWQDWGRLDAYEVLEEGLRISGVDRSRVYLTGHSMGGHGTWHLGANDPDAFAAIAPSAGWISFDTYPGPRREGELTRIWHAADAASQTRDLLDNLVQLPTYILHGEQDDNVPVEQAKEMERLLTAAGAKPHVHYESDVGHWWDGYAEPGAQCVDWPGIFALFRKTKIQEMPREIHFKTVDPSVDSKHHWLEVLQPLRYGQSCEVRASWDPRARSLVIQSENVRALRLDPSILPEWLNGRAIDFFIPDGFRGIELERASEGAPWESASFGGKHPNHSGPLKRAFTNRFVLVCGTGADDAMDTALLEQARLDAQRWMYRANGQAVLLTDTQWEHLRALLDLTERNVILYGHRFSNSVQRLHDTAQEPSALRLAPLGVRLGSEKLLGRDQAAYAVLPGRTDGTLVGILGSTSVRAARLGATVALFASGVGWPDYVVFDEGVLTKGDGGVRAAGWFDHDWRIQDGGFLREPEPAVKPR